MSEFINFEAEEEGECETDKNNNSDGNESDDDDDDSDFIDNENIEEEIHPNPYMNVERVVLPRGLQKVVNRVSCLHIFMFVYFQKKKREWCADDDEEEDGDLPRIKRRRTVRVTAGQKRKRCPSPSPERPPSPSPERPRSPNLGFPPTPPRTPSPILISSESEAELTISDSSTDSEPEEPKQKKLRICVEENIINEYNRDEGQYEAMHEKKMKPMKRTALNVKLKYNEFFPAKRQKFDVKLKDHKTYGRHSREYALKRMKDMMNTHLRVQKLNKGEEDPLTENEMALPDITIDNIPHDPIGFDRAGEDYSEEQEKILQELRFSEYLIYSTTLRKYLKLGLSDC